MLVTGLLRLILQSWPSFDLEWLDEWIEARSFPKNEWDWNSRKAMIELRYVLDPSRVDRWNFGMFFFKRIILMLVQGER